MRTTLIGGSVLTPDGFEADLCVTVEGERIIAVGGPPEGDIVDLKGAHLVPGFVDLQVNGGGDVLLNDSPDAATMARLFTVAPYDAQTQRLVTREWTRVKTGR